MNAARFDRISKLFAERCLSRRQLLRDTGLTAAAGAVAATDITTASAQDTSRPEAVAAETHSGEKTSYLFVQTFQGGTITPAEGQDGRYTVALEPGTGETIYFGDRPSRDVGVIETAAFLDGLGFPEDNPPNAALIVETEPGETDVALVELYNPMYDPATRGVTYDVEVLASWQEDLDMEFSEAPTDLAVLAPSFGTAHVFIDDCPAWPISCYALTEYVGGLGIQDNCWSWRLGWCVPCLPDGSQGSKSYQEIMAYWSAACNENFSECNGACLAYSTWT